MTHHFVEQLYVHIYHWALCSFSHKYRLKIQFIQGRANRYWCSIISADKPRLMLSESSSSKLLGQGINDVLIIEFTHATFSYVYLLQVDEINWWTLQSFNTYNDYIAFVFEYVILFHVFKWKLHFWCTFYYYLISEGTWQCLGVRNSPTAWGERFL